MKKLALFALIVAPVIGVALAQPPEPPKSQDTGATTKPAADAEKAGGAATRDHRWLKQLVGEWNVKFKIHMQADQPPAETAGTDSVRALGGHWVVAETKTTMMGAPYNGMLSLGYNAQKKHFNGTWIDSMGGTLWVYKGTLNDTGDTLTLETEGPSLQSPDKTARYKEIIQIIGEDSRTFTSSTESADGTWMKILTIEYRRKK